MFLDLTMPLGPATPVYPGDPLVDVKVAGTFASSGYLDHVLSVGTHSGTHIDAPGHMIEGGSMLDAYRPDRFVGRGCLIDLRSSPPDLSQVQANDIVLLRTGFSDASTSSDYYNMVPEIPLETAQELVRLGVKMVGIDAGSIDSSPFPIHKTLLGGDVLIIENLVGLGQLPDMSDFEVIALPLNLDVEASPARVIARN